LKAAFDPRVAALTTIPTVPGIEVLRVPPLVASSIPLNELQNFIDGSPAMRCLAEPPIDQSLNSGFLISIHQATKRPLAYPKHSRCFLLCQASLLPYTVYLLENYFSHLL
jgi:hypothetical protein